jgi:hypothetical protein
MKRVKFVRDRMSCTVLKGHWCDLIVLNIYVPTEDKTEDVKDSFCGKLECVRHKFPNCHTKILFGHFGAKLVEKTFANQQFGMRVYIKLVMIMELE